MSLVVSFLHFCFNLFLFITTLTLRVILKNICQTPVHLNIPLTTYVNPLKHKQSNRSGSIQRVVTTERIKIQLRSVFSIRHVLDRPFSLCRRYMDTNFVLNSCGACLSRMCITVNDDRVTPTYPVVNRVS